MQDFDSNVFTNNIKTLEISEINNLDTFAQ